MSLRESTLGAVRKHPAAAALAGAGLLCLVGIGIGGLPVGGGSPGMMTAANDRLDGEEAEAAVELHAGLYRYRAENWEKGTSWRLYLLTDRSYFLFFGPEDAYGSGAEEGRWTPTRHGVELVCTHPGERGIGEGSVTGMLWRPDGSLAGATRRDLALASGFSLVTPIGKSQSAGVKLRLDHDIGRFGNPGLTQLLQDLQLGEGAQKRVRGDGSYVIAGPGDRIEITVDGMRLRGSSLEVSRDLKELRLIGSETLPADTIPVFPDRLLHIRVRQVAP